MRSGGAKLWGKANSKIGAFGIAGAGAGESAMRVS
jgi:hypothetical protein